MHAVREPSASSPGRFGSLSRRVGASDFLEWWGRELASLVPRGTRAAMQRRRARPMLAIENDSATLWRPVSRGGELAMEAVATFAAGSESSSTGRAALEAALRDAGGSRRLVLALPQRQVLRRRLRLPAALEENLKAAIGYDLDRHTPFRADELYFDVAVVERDAARGEIVVDLAAARRNIVDALLAQAAALGADIVGIVPDAPGFAPASRLNLMPDERRSAGVAAAWQWIVPLAALLALVAVAIAVPVWQKREYAIALLRSVDEARAQAAVSERLRTELERLSGDYNFVLERKFAFPPAVQVLDEITKLLPDDTWLTQMEMKTVSRGKDMQRELLLRGESGNAGRLITAFEASNVFAQAAPRSPTTKIQPGPGEIFDLAAQLRPMPLPAPRSVAAAAAADAPPGAHPPASPPVGQGAPSPASSGAAPSQASAAKAAQAPATAASQGAGAPPSAPTASPATPASQGAGAPPSASTASPAAPASAPRGEAAKETKR